MSNTLLSPSVIAREALMQLKNNMVMGNLVHRDYKKEFVKVGNTVTIRKPVKFLVTDGATVNIQGVQESSTSIVINKRKHVAWAFSSEDLTLTIEEYSKRYISPAVIRLANKVDEDLCDLYKGVFLATGNAGVTPTTFKNLADAAQKLDEMAVPQERNCVLNPAAHWSIADGLKGLLYQKKVSDIIDKGYLGSVADFNIYKDQNIKSHTAGTATGYLIDGASQEGATLTIDTGTGTFVVGDIITIAGVNAVNPVSMQDTGQLLQFVVTAAAASGATSLSISPAIVTSGAYQNVTNTPDNNAAITRVDSHAANLAFHRNAFALVMVPLEMPDGAAFKAQEADNNVSIRVIKDYNFDDDVEQIRLDILYGVKEIYPDLANRVLG